MTSIKWVVRWEAYIEISTSKSKTVDSQFKNNLCEKAKADTRTPNQGRGATFIITELAVFTLEKDYSCETGYPFDDSCQIGNMSIWKWNSFNFEWTPPPPLRKNRRGGACGEDATVQRLVSDGWFKVSVVSVVIICLFSSMRVSVGWWLLRLSAKILALLRLSVNFFQLRLTKKLKINFFCFKKLNINQPVFFWIRVSDHLGMK